MGNKVKNILYILAVIIALIFLIFNENGYLKYHSIKSDVDEIDNQIKNAEKEVGNIKAETDSLINNKLKIEKVAREKYHMRLPKEKVLKIKEK